MSDNTPSAAIRHSPTSKPLRVLHVIPSVSALRGGPSFAIVEMVRAQRALGIDARIATTNDNGPSLLDVDTQDWSTLAGLPCRYFDRWSPAIRPLREFAYSSSFNRWIKQHVSDYDLLHVHALFSACSSYAMTVARRTGTPYVVRTIGQLDQWSLSQSRQRKWLFLKAFELKNLVHASAIHATSKLEAEQITLLDPRLKASIIPLGIADTLKGTKDTISEPQLLKLRATSQAKIKHSLGISPTSPLLLFLARLHPKKGLERIFKALAEHPQLGQTHLLVAGSGEPDYSAALEKLCADLRLLDRVHFVGFVKADQKRQMLLGCDLYVLPSASENFGISVLEALNAGTPALVSTGVALHELVSEQSLGAVVNLERPSNDLGETIARLLSDPTQLQKMGSKARRYTQEHYTWASIGTALLALYSELI